MNTLVILHGWQSSKEKWQRVKEQLEGRDLRVVVPDIPGFKPETALTSPWNLDNYIDWFQDFLVKQNIVEPFFLLGHSFGGRMTIKYASQNSQKLKGIILVATAGIKNRSLKVRAYRRIAKYFLKFRVASKNIFFEKVWQFFRKFFYRFILRITDYIKTSGALTETMKNVLDEDLEGLLEKIDVPTYLIWGDKDKLTPLKDGYKINKLIKKSQLKILKGIGHSPYLENSQLLVETIKKFL